MSERGLSAEQALLGSMLQDERILPDVIHTVREEDFALDVDRLIFAAMRDMYIHGKPIDGVTVRARIGQDYSDYLLQLLEVTPTAANWEAYAAIMQDEATKRRVRDLAQKLLDAPDTDQYGPLLEDIRKLSAGKRRFEIYDAAQLLANYMERQSKGEDKNYVRYGLRELDDAVHTRLGHVVVVAARPGHGKTAFALQIAREIAKTRRVGFFSLETDHPDVEDRLIAETFGIGMDDSVNYRLKQKDYRAEARLREHLSGSHAAGLDRVPYDGYLAELHADEAVLNAQEAALWRSAARHGASGAPSASPPAPSPATAQSAARRENVTIDVTLELDGQTLARKQYPLMQAEGRRRGTPLAGKEGT